MLLRAPLLRVVIVAICAPACGAIAPAAAGSTIALSAPSERSERSEGVVGPHRAQRKVGDFAVHRFSGTSPKAPLTLTEEVVGREAGWWVIDYTFEERAGTNKLRVRFDPSTDSVRRVSKLDGEREISVPVSVYEQLIERTSFAESGNAGLLASTRSTCLVGPDELDCETKTYRARVGELLEAGHGSLEERGVAAR